MLIYLLILIIIYFLLFIRKLDDIDKKSSYYFIKNSNKFNLETPIKTYIKFLYKTLLVPFKEIMYFSKYTGGGIYSSYIYEYYPKLGIDMNDKLYWAKIFNDYNINHPKIICYKKNDKLIHINNIESHTEYIKKPINGALGYKVDIINSNDIKKFSETNNNFLIQEKLYDCYHNNARHFRVVTLYDGRLFVLRLMKSNDKNTIASNRSNGGIDILCKNFICKELSNKEQLHLNKFITKLQNLHKNRYNNILSIGWDVMFNCKNKNNLNCYCLEGNICAGIWNPETEDIDTINNYKNIANNFYKINNY